MEVDKSTGNARTTVKRNKFKSRKFILTSAIMVANVAIPLLFKHMSISDSVTLMVLGSFIGMGSAYGISNVIDKKINGQGE